MNPKNKYRSPDPVIQQELFEAISKGDLTALWRALDAGAQVNYPDDVPCSAIAYALDFDSTEIIKALIEAGADLPVATRKALPLLTRLVQLGSVDLVEVALARGCDVNHGGSDDYSPLKEAVHIDRPDLVKMLIDAGADVRQANVLGKESIHYVKSAEVLEMLLDAKADINTKDAVGRTLLTNAISDGRPGLCDVVLKRGAALGSALASLAFCVPAVAETKSVFDVLCKHMPVQDVTLGGALLVAVKANNIQFFEAAISYGVDIEARDVNGDTALLVAADFQKVSLLLRLLDLGADDSARNSKDSGLAEISAKRPRTAAALASRHARNAMAALTQHRAVQIKS